MYFIIGLLSLVGCIVIIATIQCLYEDYTHKRGLFKPKKKGEEPKKELLGPRGPNGETKEELEEIALRESIRLQEENKDEQKYKIRVKMVNGDILDTKVYEGYYHYRVSNIYKFVNYVGYDYDTVIGYKLDYICESSYAQAKRDLDESINSILDDRRVNWDHVISKEIVKAEE